MNEPKSEATHEAILQKAAKSIDVPPEIYESIDGRYKSIGRWLERPNSSLKEYNPYVAPQGSFLLGTVNRPIIESDDIDVDLICRLEKTKDETSQQDLKMSVGKEVQSYASANNMNERPKNKRRCWTLKYADQRSFHIDILPCIPNAEAYRNKLTASGHAILASNERITKEAIAITDDTHPEYNQITQDWQTSNPLGYAAWFTARMAETMRREREAVFASQSTYAKVEEIPSYAVKTTLQKAIQLLKRHRDSMFAKDTEHKPISIIITTLAAKSFNNEPTLVGAITSILNDMDRFIEKIDGVEWVKNPVNPEENFADKWAEEPLKRQYFYKWLENARREFGEYLRTRKPLDIPIALSGRLGESVVKEARAGFANQNSISAPAIGSSVARDRASEMAEKVRRRGTGSAPWCAEF